ncbi:NACHT, LRR and PYD domains-containing protein 3-like isoform X2 [Erythrolamprus reginae]|uniref:NACHT, LRR and PYD domains-containing protein 3-like isoform X2 n=1 Tax=Erythrolamprus reginae TaxID=121349 RepID=UPI00396D01CC
MNNEKDHLYTALNKLREDQFKDFKWRLEYIDYNGQENIPRASLEKAKQREVVDFLIQYYEEDAVDVCISVLQKSNIRDVAKTLEEIGQKVSGVDVDAHQLISDYRNYIFSKNEKMKDPNALPGEYVLLNQRYTKVIILDYHLTEEEKEDEILATGRKHLKIISKRARFSTSIETLFNPDKYGLIPQVVVLQGAAGIGKTMIAKKIMFDWASQQLYQNKFNYVFYISCSEMNFHAESQKTSIAEIISNEWLRCHKVKNVIQNILKNEEKLLFIIDGFDELRYSFNPAENYCCIDPWKKEPVRIILSNLFQKKILPKSSLIITTRPTALEKLNQCLEYPRYFEILGFSTKEREEYFYKFFENKDQAMQAFRYVKQNDTLFTMCVIPLVSWIICTVMKQELERGKDLQKTPYTLTVIYMLYFSSLIKFHHKESNQDVQSYVKDLCTLAAEGLSNQKTLFMEEEIKKHSLVPLFLNLNLFKRDIGCIKMYSFIHLSFQEFFAALFYILEEGKEQHSQNWNINLQTLLESHKSFKPNFAMGFHFLFGFLNEGKRLKQEFGREISHKYKEFLLNCVKNNFKKSRHNFQFQKEVFGYLYETQDEDFIKNAVHDITEINYQCNSDMDLMILTCCVHHCQNLEHLDVEVPEFLYHTETELFLPTNEEWSLDERYVEDLFKALTELRNLRQLSLVGWSFTESCSRHLAKVFKNNERLKVLELSLEDTDDRAAELLCEGLQQADCKVEKLVFTGDSMTEFSSRHVAEVLCKKQRLRELRLWLHNPDDRVAEILCVGLQNQDCRVEKLGLAREFLTKVSSRHLAEVIRKNQRLREIEFSLKTIDGKTAKVLYDSLKHVKCGLEMLQVVGQVLIESGSRDSEEWKSEILRELALPLKDTFDKAIELILPVITYPDCTIEVLWYFGNFLVKSCKAQLPEILRKNLTSQEFGLFSKNTDDKTVELLLDCVKDLECNMEFIQHAGQFLIESGMITHLAEILKKNQRFRELESLMNNTIAKIIELLLNVFKDIEYTKEALWNVGHILNESCSSLLVSLRNNQGFRELEMLLKNIVAKSIEFLLEGFKYPETTKETVQAVGQFLNEFCSGLLAGFSKHQELREIELLLSSTNDQTMKLLCEGLKDPECKIETLCLLGKIPTEFCSRLLAEVLRKNQRLRVLKMSLRNSDDTAICDGLKHPECTIESLQLFGQILTDSCRKHLAEVFRKNPRCRELKLSLHNLDEKTMVVVCDWLKDPECTIEMLQLGGEILNESCSKQLVAVARKKQTMSGLCLFLKNPDDKTMEVLCDALKHSECTIEILQLAGEILTESWTRQLAEVFWKNQRLRKLKLFLKNPDDKIMELLCDSLKHPECKIDSLVLVGEILTESCSRHLAEVYRENQRLRELKLSFKNPNEKTMEVLCDELKYPEFKIETLALDGEILSESNSRQLDVVVRKKERKSVLCLSLENPDDKTMELLCEGLKHPECTIETLQLAGDILTYPCSKHLAKVLREKKSLSVLFLSLKNPDDKTMEILCNALKYSECTIGMLQVVGDVLTESCSRHLADVFRQNQRLRVLYWSLKNQDDKAIQVLCEGLKHPECTIEMLQLDGEILTESCSRHLAGVLKENHRLNVLYLSLKNPDDKSIEVLCEGLKHPECTIEILQLAQVILPESCREYLAEVLRKNHKLNVLHLYLENADDKTVEVLCEGLKHPECTIEALQLDGEFLTESCSKYLAEVLRKNQRLRKLELSIKNPHDKTMELLCEGHKDQQCKIETIQLNGKYIIQNGKWMDANHTARIFIVNFFCFFTFACLIYFYFNYCPLKSE